MNQLTQFYTKDPSERGLKVNLTNAKGEDTEYFLTIYGVDSESFNFAQSEARIKTIENMEETDKKKVFKNSQDISLDMLTSLVKSWNFTNEDGTPYPCNEKNVREFLKQAPQIAEKIDTLAANRSLFINSESKPSVKRRVKGSRSKKG